MRLVADDEATRAALAGVRPGAKVAVQGEWKVPSPDDDGGGATPPGLSSGNSRSGALPIFQSVGIDVEEEEALPSPDPGPDGASGVAPPTRRGLLSVSPKAATTSTLPLATADMKATLIPSE
mgnify:CR=1 FL=1